MLVEIGLDWFCVVFVKRKNVEFSKEMLSKFCKNLYSCFGYRLSYNDSNEMIPIPTKNRLIEL